MKKNRRGLFLVFFSLAGFAALVAVDNSRLQDRTKTNSQTVHEKTGVSPELAKKQREEARKPKQSSSQTPAATVKSEKPSGPRKTM